MFLFLACIAVVFTAGANAGTVNLQITVGEITNALVSPHTNPLENLIIAKILGVMHTYNVSVVGGDLTYSMPSGPEVVVQDQCQSGVQISKGWTMNAALKADTGVNVQLGVGGTIRQPELIIGAGFHLDSTFGFAGNIHLDQGTNIIHPGHCNATATENSKEYIKGELNIAANVTLKLQPTLIHDAAGYHIHFNPTVHVAGDLISFKALVLSHISVYGIPLTKISLLVNVAVNVMLKEEVTNKLLQKELQALQVKLQALADKVFPSGSMADLPGITPDLVAKMTAAVNNLGAVQGNHYP